jgi:hypothetical protein
MKIMKSNQEKFPVFYKVLNGYIAIGHRPRIKHLKYFKSIKKILKYYLKSKLTINIIKLIYYYRIY